MPYRDKIAELGFDPETPELILLLIGFLKN